MKKKQNQNQFVKTPTQLIKLIQQKHYNYALVLGGGLVYSRKTINYNNKTKKFIILNHIDDSYQKLTKTQLLDSKHTNIGKAMPLNSLIAIIE